MEQEQNQYYYVFFENYYESFDNKSKIAHRNLVVLDPFGREFDFDKDFDKNLAEVLTGQKQFMQLFAMNPGKATEDDYKNIMQFLAQHQYPAVGNGTQNLGLKLNAATNECSIADFSKKDPISGEYENVLFKTPDGYIRDSANNISSMSRLIKLPQHTMTPNTQRPSIEIEQQR